MCLGEAEFIFYAGAHWKEFDYKTGFKALLDSGSAEFIYRAGMLWKEFDHSEAWWIMERLIDDSSEWRGRAFTGKRWREALINLWKTIPD